MAGGREDVLTLLVSPVSYSYFSVTTCVLLSGVRYSWRVWRTWPPSSTDGAGALLLRDPARDPLRASLREELLKET